MGADTRHFRTSSPEATEALGEALGRAVPAGAVVALEGDLGSGKTCLVRGLARGLGIESGVASPTFTLMGAHPDGRLPLYHFDAWMEGREKALFLDGGDEWLHGEGVSVIEWAERVVEWLPEPRLAVRLGHASPTERTLRIALVGTAEDPLGAALLGVLRGLGPLEGVLEVTNSGHSG